MPGIDPRIIKHEITTYPGTKLVRQNLHPVNPRKTTTIKAEVEKLLKTAFIYPVQLTEWVSNPVPVNKKQGTIHMCMEFHELNKACLKDNFPTPLINHVIDECVGYEVFSFMDGFSRYNQIRIKLEDQHKKKLFVLGEHSRIVIFLCFLFTTLDSVESYLLDLASCSCKRSDHPAHL
jgi:hypothetical protein